MSFSLDRRTLLSAAAAPLVAWRRHDDPTLPVPDLAEARVLGHVAGLRPWRREGIRLEAEAVGDRTVVHNYGHGGAGVTLSWGSAEEAAALVAASAPPPAPVAVLGTGAVGLATARVLQERGHPVRVIAKDFPPHTTSNLAGAEWLPFGVADGDDPAARARFARLVRISWTRFRALLGDTWGVHERPHFDVGNGKRLLAGVPHDLIPPPRPLDKLPFAGVERSGERFTTMLIEPPTYLAELLRAVLVAGATLQARTLHDAGEVQTLPEKVVVDCMGLGAAAVFGDDTVVPVRGQLVHLFPQPLPYLLSHEGGYLFPRRDCIVLGGTYEVGVDVATPDQRTCAAILDGHRRFFAGG